MNAHTPFDAKKDWSNPYCQNSSNDQIVDALLGNAYHVVRTVYCNLGNLKLLYDFLNQYGMVIGVNSEEELKALSTQVKYSRIYGFSRAGDRQVTDYLYVESDRTGILPNDTTATGSWITVATSGSSDGGGTSSGEGAYIPWVYSNGSATGGETSINVPDGTVGVPFIIVNGDMQYVGRGFEFNVDNLSVTLAQPLEEGDEVVFLLTGVPAVPDNPNVSDWVQINWLYNNGTAVGGEQIIAIPYTFQSIPAVYKNGLRLYKGLTTESYTADPDNQRIFLTEPLATNDRLIVQIGGESTTFIMSDRTVQEVARSANVHENEVILSTNTTQYLNDKKVIYDVVAQKIYGLPALPTNVYINSVSNGQLTYSPGNITVDLLPESNDAVDSLREELSSDTGSVLVHYKNNLTNAIERTLSNRLYDHVSVKDFGAVGDWDPITQTGADDTVALQNAVTTVAGELGRNVYVPPGNYKATQVNLSSNVKIFGAGRASTLWQDETVTGSTAVIGTNFNGAGSADWTNNTHDIIIDNLRIARYSRNTYVSSSDVWQHLHLIYIGATTKFTISNCILEGFNGDGIYIAGGFGESIERHNLDGSIYNNYFIGVDNQNRNGISVIDCQGLMIYNNTFRNCTSNYQPGPIDIEPNPYTFHRVRDIQIINNRFVSCKGQASGISVVFPDVAYVSSPIGILVALNVIDGGSLTAAGAAFFFRHYGDATGSRNHTCRFVGNRATRCLRSFDVSGARNITIADNEFTEMRGGGILGFGEAGRRSLDVKILNNTFNQTGYEDGMGIGVYDVTGLSIKGNNFIDVGKGTDPRLGEVIIFKSGRSSSKVTIQNNVFVNNGRTVTSAISMEGHITDPGTNYIGGNVYQGGGGLVNKTFRAVYGNEAAYSWTPTVYGDTPAGAGTYTTQVGQYHIEGGYVHYRLLVILTAHTGSGPMNISLPTKTNINGINAVASAYVTGDIASNIGTCIGKVDGSVVNGVGRVRIYRTDGVGNVNINSAGTALTVEVSGSYPYLP